MGTFESIYENFRTNKNKYFILLKKKSASSFSPISRVFTGYESCKDNLIYLISDRVFSSLDHSALPEEASFIPITFEQFSDIISESPEQSSLKIVESESLEIIICSGDVKRYAERNSKNKEKRKDALYFCLLAILLLCILSLKALYFYVSYIFIFNLLELSGVFAAASTLITFIILNRISDKLFDNLLKDLKIEKKNNDKNPS